MKILILDSKQIREMLPMRDCIELMADALSSLARGEVFQPLRTIIRPPEAIGLLGLMPAYRTGEHGAFGMKAICVFPGNPAIGKDAHQGAVMLFSRETGELIALMNASEITAIRTAAVSAVATRVLAREDAHQLGIIGAGVQARTHLAALDAVREITRARVACRNIEHARELVREVQPGFSFPVDAVPPPLSKTPCQGRGESLVRSLPGWLKGIVSWDRARQRWSRGGRLYRACISRNRKPPL